GRGRIVCESLSLTFRENRRGPASGRPPGRSRRRRPATPDVFRTVEASKGRVMEPNLPAEPHGLHNLCVDTLRRALDVYMPLAYPGVEPPEVVRRRLTWEPAGDAEEMLGRPPFERAGKSKTTGAPIYALRLGNVKYPHMKLQVQPWPNHDGFMLSV